MTEEDASQLLQLVLVSDIIVICPTLQTCWSQTTCSVVQQASHLVYQRSDQMADSHGQRHFESLLCISKLLPSDV